MCGIFAVYNKPSAPNAILTGLKKLEYRGYDSWGIAALSNKGIIVTEKHVGKIGQAQTKLPRSLKIGMGHTRWATHGGVTTINAHPHLDCTGFLSLLHNGIVENYQELKRSLAGQGHRFLSETDTEIIVHLVEQHKKKVDTVQAVKAAFCQLTGYNAVVVLDASSRSLVAVRNGSPLVIGRKDSTVYIASDSTALIGLVDGIYYLGDSEGVFIDANESSLFSLSKKEKRQIPFTPFTQTPEQINKGKYPHYLIKEIYEQVHTIPHALTFTTPSTKQAATLLKKSQNIILTGCGTANHCALAGTYLFAQTGLRSRSYGAYELDPFIGQISAQDAVIAVSQSGETADVLRAVRVCKAQGVSTVGIINARTSSLERLVDYTVPVDAGPEIAVVSTKAFTAQLMALYRLTHSPPECATTAALLHTELTRWLTVDLEKRILELVKNICHHDHMFVIGKHLLYPAALEFALKIKETSYIHAEGYASAELKHGVIALIQKDTPCFVLADGSTQKEIVSSAIEMRSRGGYIIGVGPESNEVYDAYVPIPRSPATLSLVYAVIVGQLLGYLLGVARGTDPDKPRNLAKSVTVA